MRRSGMLCGLFACAGAAAGLALAGTVDPGLEQILASTPAGQTVSTLVFLKDQVDLDALNASLDSEQATLQKRHEVVVLALQDTAQATQGTLRDHLRELELAGRVANVQAYWITNAFRVDAAADEIRLLADHPSVGTIYYNYEVDPIAPVGSAPDTGPSRAPEPGLVAINAPQAWGLGFDGTGVLVATMDTGVDGTHPALESRWAGTLPQYAGHPQWAWHDTLNTPPTNFPTDTYGHGTHTMGTVCGGAPGDQVGVAPGAHWITDNSINQGVTPEFYSDVLSGYQWMVDPDGNPNTNWDVPAVCSNSWGLNEWWGVPPCDPTFWNALDACEAAGIVILFSAGNEGPGPNTLRRPGDRATDDYRTCAVAAVDANTSGWPIADFSSRGPTDCTPNGSPAIKPDIAAPGVNVRSAYPGGGYTYLDGTSMASPHVNGVVALIRQACPNLTVQQVKQIIYATAHDLGSAGEDNSYGWGMVDAYAAVVMAQSMCGPHAPHANDGTLTTGVNVAGTATLAATDDGLPDPPGVMTYIIASLPAHGHLRDPNGGWINGAPYTLLNDGNAVVYRPDGYYSGADSFTFKANDGGTPPSGGDSNAATISVTVGLPEKIYGWNLDTDPGWTTQGQWAWGTPTGGSGDHGGPDPTSGHTGTKVYGYNLSGGYVNNMPEYHLTTAAFNCTNVTQISLRLWRWLGVEQSTWDHAYVRVSTNGSSWTAIWQNPDITIDENAWSFQQYDLHAYADNLPTVYLRWTMGTTDTGWTYCGWNLDDIEIWGVPAPTALLGDPNCDGVVNAFDIDPFVLALTDPAAYAAVYPYCNRNLADCNGDGSVDAFDIDPFVALLVGK